MARVRRRRAVRAGGARVPGRLRRADRPRARARAALRADARRRPRAPAQPARRRSAARPALRGRDALPGRRRAPRGRRRLARRLRAARAARSASWSATSSAAASPRRARWASCAARCGRWPAPASSRPRSSGTSTRSSSRSRRRATRRSPTPRSTPETGAVTFASAGHLPPVLLGPGRAARAVHGAAARRRSASPLPAARAARPAFALAPGAGFLLYTDGLVERRGEPIDAGLERLLAAVRASPGAPRRAGRGAPGRSARARTRATTTCAC